MRRRLVWSVAIFLVVLVGVLIFEITPKPNKEIEFPFFATITEKFQPVYYFALKECQGVSQITTSEKVVALTFDDGPDKKYTKEILSILNRLGIKATFFILGSHAKENPEIVKEIFSDGHIIANHSFSHPKLPYLSKTQIENEVEETRKVITSIVGVSPALFRPPYGVCSTFTTRTLKNLGYTIITWSALTNDYSGGVDEKYITEAIVRKVSPGGIIVLHDGSPKGNEDRRATVKALPRIIETLFAQGYDFATVPELLRLKPYRN